MKVLLFSVGLLCSGLAAVTATSTPSPFPNCPETGTALFPDPKNCTNYLVCVNGDYMRLSCNPGYYYSEEQGRCDLKENVKCPLDPAPVVCPQNGTALFPDPDDCEKYIVCIDGKKGSIDCPRGYAFNPTLGKCDLRENVDCRRPNDPDCPEDGWIYLPDPGNCKYYYFCVGGDAIHSECPNGGFDEATGWCNDNAPCLGMSTTPRTSSSSPTSSSTSTTSSSSTSSSSSPTSSSSTSTSPSTTEEPSTPAPIGECKEEGDLLPNPTDCSSFYQCSGGNKILIKCPSGLEFNDVEKVCDNPATANCSV